jgi:hypothetical protein
VGGALFPHLVAEYGWDLGMAYSLGTPTFTTNPVTAWLNEAVYNEGYDTTEISLSGNDVLDNLLAFPQYASYYTYTDNATPLNITFPSFTVNSAVTGLNLEALPPLDYGTYTLAINSITITAFGITPSTPFVCTPTQTYTTSLTGGVTWSGTGDVATMTTSGNNCTLTEQQNGQLSLTATYQGTYATITNTQTINFGAPFLQTAGYDNAYNGSTKNLGYYPAIINSACTGYDITTTNTFTGATSITWSLLSADPSPVNYSVLQNNNIETSLYDNGQTAIFEEKASNVCGTTTDEFEWEAAACGSSGGGGGCPEAINISPNPASTTLIIQPDIPPGCNSVSSGTVTSDASQAPVLSQTSTTPNTNSTNTDGTHIPASLPVVKGVKIFDASGRQVKSVSFGTGTSEKISLDIHTLTPGIYFLEIEGQSTIVTKKLMVGGH